MRDTEQLERNAVLLAALQELNELSSRLEEMGERSETTVRAQAERFALARRVRDVCRDLEKASNRLHEREQERLWRVLESQDMKSAVVELPEGTRRITRTHATYPGLNTDVVDTDDPEAKATANRKIMEFLRQTGDYESLVDEEPSIVWTRMRRKEFRERWFKEEGEGNLRIPPEIDLHPRQIIRMSKA